MSRFDELLERSQGSAVYPTLDFADAFLQIPNRQENRHKTALHTNIRMLEYTSRPSELATAPAEPRWQASHEFFSAYE